VSKPKKDNIYSTDLLYTHLLYFLCVTILTFFKQTKTVAMVQQQNRAATGAAEPTGTMSLVMHDSRIFGVDSDSDSCGWSRRSYLLLDSKNKLKRMSKHYLIIAES
jgi:hypothetical protein